MVLQVETGKTLSDIDFRIAPFKKGTWETYIPLDGLAGNAVRTIYQDADGYMWFGTDSGVSRYDGENFVNLTTDDGVANNVITAIYRDDKGIMWFGTREGGVSRYDGKTFKNFTTADGLASNSVSSIAGDADGFLWFGTGGVDILGRGVSRYDGQAFTNLAHVKS